MTRLAALLLSLLTALPVQAKSPIGEVICAPTDQMQRKLIQQFKSEKRGVGVRNPEEVLEIWLDEEGDWTMVIAYASGRSCIVAMGGYWQDLPPADPA
jgi:hypothetical protein